MHILQIFLLNSSITCHKIIIIRPPNSKTWRMFCTYINDSFIYCVETNNSSPTMWPSVLLNEIFNKPTFTNSASFQEICSACTILIQWIMQLKTIYFSSESPYSNEHLHRAVGVFWTRNANGEKVLRCLNDCCFQVLGSLWTHIFKILAHTPETSHLSNPVHFYVH